MTTYATIEEASKAALSADYECGGQRYECGGVIYVDREGRYSYTPPVTDHKPFGVTITYLYSVPPLPGLTLVADHHNHVCQPHNRMFAEYFSPADGMVNEGFHLIGYMVSGCSGYIHRFDPNEWPREVWVVHFKSGKELELPIGHISGMIPLR